MKTYKTNNPESEAVKDFIKKNDLKEATKEAVIYEYYLCEADSEKPEAVFKLYIGSVNTARKFVAFYKKQSISVVCGNYTSSETAKLIDFIKKNTAAIQEQPAQQDTTGEGKKDEKTKK